MSLESQARLNKSIANNYKTWLARAADYQAALSIRYPRLFDKTGIENTASRQADYVDELLSKEPGDYLQELAKEAGVSYSELQSVMAEINGDDGQLSTKAQNILERLQRSASKKPTGNPTRSSGTE